jgi:hypothetical protein
VKKFLRHLRAWLLAPLMTPRPSTSTREVQVLLALAYRTARQQGLPPPKLAEVGFRVFSEADEDGIPHFIFSVIGLGTRRLVDIGAGQIHGSNTTNLIVNGGWSGLLIDGDPNNVNALAAFYGASPDTKNWPPRCVQAVVTAENVNRLLEENGLTGEIDLLSIDVDGNDYWIWKAIDVVTPRVVVVEYQCILGPERSWAVPYSPDFKGVFHGEYGIYTGASLAAFVLPEVWLQCVLREARRERRVASRSANRRVFCPPVYSLGG